MSDERAQHAAHACGEHQEPIRRLATFPIHGVAVEVEEEMYRCRVCGEEEFTYEQAQAVQAEAARRYRQMQGLLQPEDIRRMRLRWSVSQAELEQALGVGRKTVSRWEAGRVLQNRSVDSLLRAIDRYPHVLAFLAEQQGVTLRSAPPAAATEMSEQPPAQSELRIPRSLLSQMETEAEDEGVDVATYVAAVLARHSGYRAGGREVAGLHDEIDRLNENVSRWTTPRLPEVKDPWQREHEEEYGSSVAY